MTKTRNNVSMTKDVNKILSTIMNQLVSFSCLKKITNSLSTLGSIDDIGKVH